jgi:6-phosphogluconolactonase
MKPSPLLLYAGTYAAENANGVYLYHLDPVSGALTEVGRAQAGANPSFLTPHPDGRHLYAVNELTEFQGQPGGAVSALAVDPEAASLSPINQRASHGTLPCHLTIDRTAYWLLVANYGNGTLAVYPIEADGSLGPASDVIQHQGKGLDPQRQEGPHAHMVNVTPDNRFVLACDLGIDKLLTYQLDLEKGQLLPHAETVLPPGSGPRHLDFHPSGKYVYVINELSATLMAFTYDTEAGRLNELQTVPAFPDDYFGEKAGAEILVHPSGKFVYSTNRGQSNSLAGFAVDESAGRLTLVGHTSTLGRTPRSFVIDPNGRFLLVANQDSGSLVVFEINIQTGDLSYLSKVNVPAPTCLMFAPL